MKRFLCLLIVLSLSVFIFSQEIEYRCIEKTYGSSSKKMYAGVDGDGKLIVPEEIIKLSKKNEPYFYGAGTYGYNYHDTLSTFYGKCNNNEEYYFNLDAFEIVGSDKLPCINYTEGYEYNRQSSNMIASYYFDILKKNNISAIYEYEPFWKDNEYITPVEHFSDYYSAHRRFVISNTRLFDNKKDCHPNPKEIYLVGLDYYALIKEIKKINENLYTVKVFCREDRFDSNTNFIDEFVDLYKNEENLFYFEFDGDYVKISLNEKNNVIGTYVIITSDINKQLNDIARGNKADLSKVTWPRHADGSCDYDESKKAATVQTTKPKSTTNVTQNKIMLVNENLKLRSGEATTTSVLTVMSAGTKVKILQLGKAETIDGINSNWVKVEVQRGAKDRDGKEIKEGTVGWCYGGYLN